MLKHDLTLWSRVMTLPRLLFLCAPLPLVACAGAGSPPAPTPEPTTSSAPAPTPDPAPDPAPLPAAVTKGPARETWEALVASGCDLNAARIFTSVEARVVRNVPFALKGYRFKDVNLRLFFEADGGWYTPQTDEPPALSPEESACVERLKTLEAELHKALPFPEEMAARMTRDHALFVVLRMWAQSHERSPYGDPRFAQDEEGAWRMWSTYADCTPSEDGECGGYSIMCPSETPCESLAAG